jgi:hypothetical protein
MVNILSKQVNFLLSNDFAFKFFAKIFSITNNLLLQEWGDFLLDLMLHSNLFITFLIQNDLFKVFLNFFFRNLQSDIFLENSFNALSKSKKSPSKSLLNRSTSDLFYHRLFGFYDDDTPFNIDKNLFQKVLLELIGTENNIIDKDSTFVNKMASDIIPRNAVDRDGLPIPSWDLLALRKFEKVFTKNSEALNKSKLEILNFNVIFPSLSLAIKFISIAFLKNRTRAFFKNYVSNELLSKQFVKILGEIAQNVLKFSLDLSFFDDFYSSGKKFDFIEKMNFLIKFIYSTSDNFHDHNVNLLDSLKIINDSFFQKLSKEVKASPQNALKSDYLLLKVYEEPQFPFGDCAKMKVKHSKSYSEILKTISQFCENIPFFSVLYRNFDDNEINVSESEKHFRDIVSKLDALHTYYDDVLEIKLIVKEETIQVMLVQCSTCPNKFEVEHNPDSNRDGQIICTLCQQRFISWTASKKQFYSPFRNN